MYNEYIQNNLVLFDALLEAGVPESLMRRNEANHDVQLCTWSSVGKSLIHKSDGPAVCEAQRFSKLTGRYQPWQHKCNGRGIQIAVEVLIDFSLAYEVQAGSGYSVSIAQVPFPSKGGFRYDAVIGTKKHEVRRADLAYTCTAVCAICPRCLSVLFLDG